MVHGYENAKEASARIRENKTSSMLANAWARRAGEPAAAAPAPTTTVSGTDTAPLPAALPGDDDDGAPTPPAPAPAPSGPADGTIVEHVAPPARASDASSPWTALSEAFLSRARRLRPQASEARDATSEASTAEDEVYAEADDTQSAVGTHTDASDDLLGDLASTADVEEDEADESLPQHLVFCIHGIGQKLSEDYQATHFVHDLERLRTTLRQQAQHPEMARQLSGARIKLIPICWRHRLDFEPEHGAYTLSDITNDQTIPAVRAVIAKVLLDIPFYMSAHRAAMLRAVREEANRLYRLFVQRNPTFEQRGGRVSVLGHSLGSALASDLLAAQPTHVAPLSTRDAPRLHLDARELLFNVAHFFSVGSPLPLLFYLNGTRLVARRRTTGTNVYQQQDDVTLDATGVEGCLAVEQIHNVRHRTDPDLCRDGPGEFPAVGDRRCAVRAAHAPRRSAARPGDAGARAGAAAREHCAGDEEPVCHRGGRGGGRGEGRGGGRGGQRLGDGPAARRAARCRRAAGIRG